MAYILNKTDGTALVTVANNSTTADTYSVTFIGKNYLAYGEALNESLLHLLENSASTTNNRPENPVIGQTWYNKTDKTLYVCYQEAAGTTAALFQALAKSNSSFSQPSNPIIGDLWYDRANEVFKFYRSVAAGWDILGPTKPNWTQTDSTQPDFIKNKPTTFGYPLTIKNKDNVISKDARIINFVGRGVVANLVDGTTDSIEINVPGSSGSASAVNVGSAPPQNPVVGQLWYENSSLGRGFIYDGVQWVDFSPAIGSGSSTPSTTPAPSNIPIAASTSFTLATTDGSAKSMGVVLTPGTWQVILDTRLITNNDYNHDATMTQTATVGSVTVTTSIKTNRGGGAGHGRSSLGSSDIAVGEFTLTVDTPIVMSMAAAVPGDSGMQAPMGSTLTVSKIASTDAQKIYSGTMPTFTLPSAGGIGIGQTWKNVTANRAADTPYQNTTGKPIMVVVLPNSYNTLNLFVSSDNSNWVYIGTGSAFSSSDNSIGGIVPNQHWYKTTGDHRNWAELR